MGFFYAKETLPTFVFKLCNGHMACTNIFLVHGGFSIIIYITSSINANIPIISPHLIIPCHPVLLTTFCILSFFFFPFSFKFTDSGATQEKSPSVLSFHNKKSRSKTQER